MGVHCRGPAPQHGRAGAIMLLVVVLVVAVLAATALKQYIAPAAVAGAGKKDAPDADTGTAATPRDALERARGLEDSLHRQTADREKRLDEAESGKPK